MHIQILGCGEAFDENYGNNACLLRGSKNIPTVLFDCGYQIPERLWKLNPLYKRLDAIYFTHSHADHSFGIVPLLVRFWEEKRKKPLTIMGPRGMKTYMTRLMQLGYPGMLSKLTFALEFEEKSSGDRWHYKGLQFECARSQHSVVNLSVRVTDPRGKTFAVSGDGQHTQETQQLFNGTDLLLQEVYTLKPQIPSHCDLQTLSDYAKTAGIKKIVITHASRQQRSKLEKALAKQQGHNPQWIMALPQAIYKI